MAGTDELIHRAVVSAEQNLQKTNDMTNVSMNNEDDQRSAMILLLKQIADTQIDIEQKLDEIIALT